jgi:hypothetical protein
LTDDILDYLAWNFKDPLVYKDPVKGEGPDRVILARATLRRVKAAGNSGRDSPEGR